MSTNPPATLPTGKLASPTAISNYSQAPINIADTASKRSNSSSRSGPSARQNPQPRGNQPLRKQHKASRRARLADEEDAFGGAATMRPFNSRKGQTSITHLMNFSLPPRPQYQYHSINHRHQRRYPTWGLGSGYHAVDKARYVHANYRFVVRPDKEYHTQAVDADVHLPWDAVLQILGSAETQSTSCPICLSPPVAPRMAKCGHIFCLPCLIRYMHSTDDINPVPEKKARYKRCPICEDSIYMSDTRPLRWFIDPEASQLHEGGDVLLKLMKREQGSTLALPRDAAENYGHQDDIPWYHVAEVMDYARFIKGGEEYMVSQYDQEITDLELQAKEDELIFGDDSFWTKRAINAIEDSKRRISGMGNPPFSVENRAEQQVGVLQSWEDESEEAEGEALTSSFKKLKISEPKSPPTTNSQNKPRPGRHDTHTLYFYHALPNFFLSPLDIRILKAAYGDFSAFPTTILPRIEHISTGHVIDDDLRKRAKYMAHLPYGCEVSFLECDWTDIISQSILDQFRESLQHRRKRNQEKEAREERDRLRAEKEEDDKRLASIRRRRPSIAKSISEPDFQPLVSAEATPPMNNDMEFGSTPPWGNQRTQSSFATLATPGTSPDAPRTVWGTAAVAPRSPPLVAAPPPPAVDDGWLQDWENDLMDGTDAVTMMETPMSGEASSSSRPAAPAAAAAAASTGHGKKSKKKKITLMSTNTRRGA